jgi:hypothetical protein
VGPVFAPWPDSELVDEEAEEVVQADEAGGEVCLEEVVASDSSAGAQVEVRKGNVTLASRMPLVSQYLPAVLVVQRIGVGYDSDLPWRSLAIRAGRLELHTDLRQQRRSPMQSGRPRTSEGQAEGLLRTRTTQFENSVGDARNCLLCRSEERLNGLSLSSVRQRAAHFLT